MPHYWFDCCPVLLSGIGTEPCNTACREGMQRIQWNLSNQDTNGAEESVIDSEVSSFQRLKCTQEWYTWGGKRCPV